MTRVRERTRAQRKVLGPYPEQAKGPRPCHKTWQAEVLRFAQNDSDYGTVFFFLSTLLPITPPRIPPTAAPMRPPFTLFLLVTAPITAPAPAPIAASRCVCFSV